MSETPPVHRPLVARPPRRTPVAGVAAALALIGFGVFFWLSDARAASEQDASSLPPLTSAATPAPAPWAKDSTPREAVPEAQPYLVPTASPVTLSATPTDSFGPAPFARPAPASDGARERLRAPTLIVDLAHAESPPGPGAARTDSGVEERSGRTTLPTPTPTPTAAPTPNANRDLSDTERFSERIGDEEVRVVKAERMTSLNRLVPQGAIIGAVMETALNSDHPGYARAITQRDVYSFDGSAVLVPAGSRLIGQYKSGLAEGASRVFILWTRLIRPDGVSIDLASPLVDELGRGGLAGKVKRHFFQRFGGAILTSVLTGGISALVASQTRGSSVIVTDGLQASNLANQANQSTEIPPTITTRQGAPVRVFVARDLDFSEVGPAQ